MKKIVKLTESDLLNIIKKVVSETNIVKDKIKHSPYNPKMESEEMDEEWGSADDADRYNCCKRKNRCGAGMCVNCRCVDKIRV